MQFDLTDRETIFTSLPKGGVGAEIGVADGGFSEIILRNAEPREMYLIDCWEHQPVEVYGHDPANHAQPDQDVRYNHVVQKFLSDARVHVIKQYSADAAPRFSNGFFDWLYLDANHLLAYQDIQLWWPKVKEGGYLMGHDYVKNGVGDYVTVQADVDRFVAETGLPLLLTDDPVWQCWILEKPHTSLPVMEL